LDSGHPGPSLADCAGPLCRPLCRPICRPLVLGWIGRTGADGPDRPGCIRRARLDALDRTIWIGRQKRTRCIGRSKTADALGFRNQGLGSAAEAPSDGDDRTRSTLGRQIGRQRGSDERTRWFGRTGTDGSIEGPAGPISCHFSLLNQVAGNSLRGLPGLIYYRGERSYAYCDQSSVGHNNHLTHFTHIFTVFSHGRAIHIIAVFLHIRFLHIFAGFLQRRLIHNIAGFTHG
jgi:hypothetical protein